MTYRIRGEEPTESTSNTLPNTLPNDEQWTQNTLRDVLLEAYREQRRTRIWRNIWRTILLILFLALMFGGLSTSNKSDKTAEKLLSTRSAHTAVINLTGTIGGDEFVDQVDMLRTGMSHAYQNSNVRAIIIRANSPGGSPVVSNVAFSEIRRLKSLHQDIPVYVVAEDMCASGCYYIAAAADKIFADPSSMVGSIGVIGSSFDATELMDKIGVKRRVRIAGDNKGMGDPFTPEIPEQEAIWQEMLTQVHQAFIQAVRQGRGERLKESEYPDLYSGRVFTGIEAKKAGLIDDFGNIYSVARDVVKAPELVDYTPTEEDLVSLLNRRLGLEVRHIIEQKLNNIW